MYQREGYRNPIPTTDITPPADNSGPGVEHEQTPRRTRRSRPEPDRELAAMSVIMQALDSLPDDATRCRVVNYFADRVDFPARIGPPSAPVVVLPEPVQPAVLPRRPVPLAPVAEGPTLSDAARERLASLPSAFVAASGMFDDGTGTSVSGKCVELLTPEEWLARDCPDVQIIDRDGWAPEDWGRRCTEVEFRRRLALCTVRQSAPAAVNPFASPPGFPTVSPPAPRATGGAA